MILAFHKPYGVLSRFTSDGSPHRTLAEFALPPRVYPIGRLDADSEGLLLLSDEPRVSHLLLDPERGHQREYWVQVERVPDEGALAALGAGVVVQGRRTREARARLLDDPGLPPRDPPIRVRRAIPTAWIALELVEGRNRQVRRMTAAVGYPTLRLVRVRIGRFELGDLAPGTWRALRDDEIPLLFRETAARAEAPAARPRRRQDGAPRQRAREEGRRRPPRPR